jgi:CRISPR system Cascade subunit CasC
MQLIELHILQSFPVSCLNRDDVGSPKSAIFGGVTRSRISSQSLKRAIREFAQDQLPEARFGGERTKLIVEPFVKALQKHGVSDEKVAFDMAREIAGNLSKLEDKSPQIDALIFLAPSEIDGIAAAVAELKAKNGGSSVEKIKEKKSVKDLAKSIEKACKSAGLVDGADIAIFGRMAASLPSLTLEGAAMFSHALSTHKSENDLDFYTAVDDLKPKGEDAGAGMMGTLEFSSAVYYRYAALNLDLLANEAHLGSLSSEQRRGVVSAFICATLQAVPGARKNSMNAHVKPSYVLGTYKSKGQPVQLINAFENPIRSKGRGLVEESIEQLKTHHADLKKTWGIRCEEEVELPGQTLAEFCQALSAHVR